jgi:hypothetical protein
MLTFRALQPSRLAMLSVVMDASIASSSSQRRPRAIAATNVARVSERIGRACCDSIPSGRRISRRRMLHCFSMIQRDARGSGGASCPLRRGQIAASSGRFTLNREIPVCAGLRGGAEKTRTACQARSRYRTGLSRVIQGGNSAIKCR